MSYRMLPFTKTVCSQRSYIHLNFVILGNDERKKPPSCWQMTIRPSPTAWLPSWSGPAFHVLVVADGERALEKWLDCAPICSCWMCSCRPGRAGSAAQAARRPRLDPHHPADPGG